jgi:hypothetical protein
MSASIVVVSPHFDDAGLSCVSLMARNPHAVVLTVFGGGPARIRRLSRWDRASGFSRGDDVVGTRVAEDAHACGLVGATPLPLGHWDSQYRNAKQRYSGPTGQDLAHAIARTFDDALKLPGPAYGAATWAVPVGIGHDDHVLTSETALTWAMGCGQHLEIILYEELPYAAEHPHERSGAFERVRKLGYHVEPMPVDVPPGVDKSVVVKSYKTQLAPLGRGAQLAIDTPEAFYRLTR